MGMKPAYRKQLTQSKKEASLVISFYMKQNLVSNVYNLTSHSPLPFHPSLTIWN